MKKSNDLPIGVIDSGVGGLTVVKEILRLLPAEKIIYIGDDARCPYGPRSVDEVKKFTMEMAVALSDMNIKMLVVACNTATAVALEDLRERFSFPVIGVIEPGARAALRVSSTGKIVVLGTVGTVNSGAYENAISTLSVEAKTFALACPEFVPLVESGQYKSSAIGPIIEGSLRPIANMDFDTVILGCTHYPLLHDEIRQQIPVGVKIVSSANETVLDVEKTLVHLDMLNACDGCNPPLFYTTGHLEVFRSIAKDWLEIESPDVRHIAL